MTKKIIPFILFLFTSIILTAQSVYITEDPLVTRMIQQYVEINRSTEAVSGWRIQLMATTDRSKMEKEKKEFLQKYPEIKIDWIHSKPYYKLRAGAFASKLEATALLYTIKKDYPSAYPAKDNNINPIELIEN